MRVQLGRWYIKLWLSASDTEDWAERPGARWPCSQLSGHRLFAEFDRNGLVDLAIDGKEAGELDGTEFNACCANHLARSRKVKRLKNSPWHEEKDLYFVAVGQFLVD